LWRRPRPNWAVEPRKKKKKKKSYQMLSDLQFTIVLNSSITSVNLDVRERDEKL
jgi:hypothetical protein